MITLEDCVGFCGLTEEEVLAIVEHEHLPEIAATALAQYLLSQEHGSESVRDMIVDDIRCARRSGLRPISQSCREQKGQKCGCMITACTIMFTIRPNKKR